MSSAYPDFTGDIAVDTETYDPFLLKEGPGFLRQRENPEDNSRLLGVSLGCKDLAVYVPLEATDVSVNREGNLRYIKDQLGKSSTKYFANAVYDLESLNSVGLVVEGRIVDVFSNEHLLNENNKRVNLENLGQQYCTALLEAQGQVLSLKESRGSLYTLPLAEITEYAKLDAMMTWFVAMAQQPLIEKASLGRVQQLESDMVPILWALRKNGVRINLETLDTLEKTAKATEESLIFFLEKELGHPINIWSPKDLLDLFTVLSLPIFKTLKGNPSFKNQILEKYNHPIIKTIRELRSVEKLKRDFIKRYQRDHINGRIHAQFHLTRTVTGRMSSSRPNLQQVPKRSDQGALIRRAFIPDPGYCWESLDYSSQEPRIAVVLGKARKIPEAMKLYRKYLRDPKLDFHAIVAKLSNCSRVQAKSIGLGKIYGRGMNSTVSELSRSGLDPMEAEDAFLAVRSTLSWIQDLDDAAYQQLSQRGYVNTLLGRRRRIKNESKFYRAVNSQVQGSAAEQLKLAMVAIHKETGAVPLLPVHDELNYNLEITKNGVPDDETHKRRVEIMESVFQESLGIDMPFPVDSQIGGTW